MKKALGRKEITRASRIFAYVSFRSEVSTLELIDQLLLLGKEVSVPYTRVGENRLDAVRIKDRKKDLIPGYCDIPEPHQELRSTNTIDPETIETILLPGSVFDLRGGRFGYGGGYYDRLLSAHPEACRIGLCFELQLVDKAPLAPHDELLDLIITESRIIHNNR